MGNQAEANSLWQKMMQLERQRPSPGENGESFFNNKRKEMIKLRDAYDKATGLDSRDPNVAKAIADNNLIKKLITGGQEGAATRDELNQQRHKIDPKV